MMLVSPCCESCFSFHCSTVKLTVLSSADHDGVPNLQLIKENSPLAMLYDKSIAEQNSVAISWALLMEDRFSELRQTIYTTPEELRRFRQLVCNCVMATDIMDKDLLKKRSAKWAKVFGAGGEGSDPSLGMALDSKTLARNKATILLDHLIQASDVAHTMQRK